MEEATFTCEQHGVTVRMYGERWEHRDVQMPPPATPGSRMPRSGGGPGECALLTARTPAEGEMARPGLQGTCHVNRAGVA